MDKEDVVHSDNGILLSHKKEQYRDFPGDPVAKTLHSQCREPGFNPWSGN